MHSRAHVHTAGRPGMHTCGTVWHAELLLLTIKVGQLLGADDRVIGPRHRLDLLVTYSWWEL